MPTYAFASEDDFRRAAKAILRSEHTPQNKRGRRARWQGGDGGGGGGARPYVITQLNDADNVAVFRDVNENWDRAYTSSADRALTFEAKPSPWNDAAEEFVVDDTADAVGIYSNAMSGVTFTGEIILVQSVGGKKCCVGGYGHIFTATASEDIAIDAGGLISINLMSGGTAIVFARNDTSIALVADDALVVEFVDNRQLFLIQRKLC